MERIKEKLDSEKYKLEQLREWNSNADMKISIILTLMGILFADLIKSIDFNILEELRLIIKNVGISNITLVQTLKIVIVSCVYIFSTLSIIQYLRALIGKIDIKLFLQKGIFKKSLFFFGSISAMNYTEYRNNVKCCDEQREYEDLSSQVYINSQICNSKFNLFNRGLLYTKITVLLFMVCKLFNLI